MQKKLVFSTRNEHKLGEVQGILKEYFALLSLNDVKFTQEIEETGNTFQENALIKARAVYQTLKMPCIADDSGLEVDALGGAPGVYSARYAGEKATDQDNTALLLKNMQGKDVRSARFKCVIAYIDAQGKEYVFEGAIEGSIIDEEIGGGGFGYDPVFVPNGYNQTLAEISFEEKNKISHRALALQKFLVFLDDNH